MGSWFNETLAKHGRPEYEGLRLLSLEEVLDRYRHCVRLCIELKQPHAAPGVERELLRLLGMYELDLFEGGDHRVMVMTSNQRCLRSLASLHPALPLTKLFPKMHTSRSIRGRLNEVRDYVTSIGVPQRVV
ncbi:MAG: glycerophosphodiester phosphodiesterase, partial [Actinomycetota bacterium]